MINQYSIVLAYAAEAHAGQKYDKFGDLQEPYICHPIRVAGRVSEEASLVALLHDVVEDTDKTLLEVKEDVSRRGAPLYAWEIEAIGLLTRHKEEMTYMEYIERLDKAPGKAGVVAREVKMADLRENLCHNPPEHLRKRYLKALGKLMYQTD